MKKLIVTILLSVAVLFILTNITLFVTPPIGALPQGSTVVLFRSSAILRFVDSADAICDREISQVSLLCRGVTLGAVTKNNNIILRLPYIQTLYLLSTGGKTWEH